MKQSTIFLVSAALMAQIYAAPQGITFSQDGKIGVDFLGFKAGVGFNKAASAGGLGGGLIAEAGTPFGQHARAGLGGGMGAGTGLGGQLFADATAGGNVRAGAGLQGAIPAEHSHGAVGTEGQAAVATQGGTEVSGSSGFAISGGSSFAVEKNVHPVVHTTVVETVKPVYKEVKTEIKTETHNEVLPPPVQVGAQTGIETRFNVEAHAAPPVVVKEVYAEPLPSKVYHKEIIRYKPHRRHHFHKTAYIGGYIGGGGEVAAPPPPPPAVVYETYQPTVYKTVHVQPAIEKRVDVDFNAGAGDGGHYAANGGGAGGIQHTYTKQISVHRNPTFFADIFNIPISTLKAVGNFLGNAAGSTNVSVQKSATVHAEKDSASSKHLPTSSSSSSSSETHVSVQTPPVSSFLDDIFAIPINTLGAVNKFLENNVSGRKNIQVTTTDDEAVVTKVRRGPHARRRANKHAVIVEESDHSDAKDEVSEQH